MDDDSLDEGEVERAALCNLLAKYAARGGAGASEGAVAGTLEACEQAWLAAWALPDDICREALGASRDVWKEGGAPGSIEQCEAWKAAAGKAAEAMAEGEEG